MGGKKKLSLKQMERMQMRKSEEEKKKKEKEKAALKEKKLAGILIPDIRSGKMLEELKKMRVLTPYTVASRFNIRISAAKDLLENLENDGLIQLVSGNHNIKIYKTMD
ncbi:MAG: 30S ribosomal protein S25e [Candidatus Bathyarchaeota archaeon]|nr:30S ribosomal protein S25e [Candidatus Bathyarchaeota archaeon]MDW8040266.1 30S ribosomal protein S25e [Nitrososphaerota archaeon]